jgi:chitodextrinase
MTDQNRPLESDESNHDSTTDATSEPSRRRFLQASAGVGAIAASAGWVGEAAAEGGIPTPWLHRDGNKIKDPQDRDVILRGVNIADPVRLSRNWRSKDAMEVFAKATDTGDGWHTRVVRVPTQPQDISSVNSGLQMAHGDDWGPLLPGQFDETDLEAYFSGYIDPLVDAAEEAGVYVMLDYHRHFPIFHQPQHEDDLGEYQCGNQSFPNDIGFCGERGVLWNSEAQADQLDGYAEAYAQELHEELQSYWNFVAPRYADRSHVIYDVYNEPTGPYAGDWGSPTRVPHDGNDEGGEDVDVTDPEAKQYWDLWVDRAQPWVDTVREHAPQNLVTIGSPRWSQYTYWAPTNEFEGDNICYTGHVYTHDSVRPLSEYYGEPAKEVPVFFSEFGWAEGGGKDNFDFLEGTADEYADEFEAFLDEYPVHPICWNFDHTWEPAFFKHDTSQDGDWEMWDYQSRPGKWWQEYLATHKDDDLPGQGDDVGDTVPPTMPQDLSVVETSEFSATVDWTAATDEGTGVDRYVVYVDGSEEMTVGAATTTAAATALAPAKTYEIGVRAVDEAGNRSPLATVSATTDADDGGDDESLLVDDFAGWPGANALGNWTGAGAFEDASLQDGAVRLAYDDAGWFATNVRQTVADFARLELDVRGDAGGEEADVQLEVGAVEGMLADLADDSITTDWSTVSVDLADAGVETAMVDDVRLNCFHGGNGAVEIDAIRFAAGTEDDEDTVAPGTPAPVTASGVSTTSVSLAWSSVTDTGGSGLANYVVAVDGTETTTIPVGTTETTVTGLEPDTEYEFSVLAEDATGNRSSAAAVTTRTEPAEDGGDGPALVVNDYDGSPAWPQGNDLGNWNGAGSFANGGGDGAVIDDALVLEYDNSGWLVEQVLTDVSDYDSLVLRLKGEQGGEADDCTLELGGTSAVLADLTDDDVTTEYRDIVVDMDAAGIDASAPGELRLNFWQGATSTLHVDGIRFE